MLIGYTRVSKADGFQTTDLQRDALTAAGVDSVHVYEDQASGKREDRPGLASCLKALRPGDTLVVWKRDRLGRDLRHLINTVHDLTGRGVGLKVLSGHGAAIDTTTAAVQDDCCQAALSNGGNGATRDQGRQSLRGTRHYPTNALPACVAQGRTATGWRKAALPRFSRINGGDLERGSV